MDYYFIGDRELLTAFRLVGIEGSAVSNAGETREAFLSVTGKAKQDCRVLILTEKASDWLGSLVTDWQMQGSYPLIVEVPGIMGPLPGRKTLVDSINEAIGIHI
jgi:V/A-type H+-transporting ATPase subunit F